MAVKVVVPFTRLRDEARAALDEWAPGWEGRDVSADDEAYWRLLADLWAEGESFVLVEHDVVIVEGIVDALAACPFDWCCAAYPYGRGTIVGLGCTKFTAPLLARVPDAVERAGLVEDRTHPPRHWCRLDASLNRVLCDAGEPRCYKHPDVGHMGGGGSAHGCRVFT